MFTNTVFFYFVFFHTPGVFHLGPVCSTPHVFHTPHFPDSPYPVPGPWPCVFLLADAAMILPTALHLFLVRKRTFVTLFATYELLSYELVSFRKSKIQQFCCVVNSMKEIYKKVILISFSAKPVLRFQFFSGFWQTLSRQNSPPLPSARNFATWLFAQYANWKNRRIADGGSFVVTYQQFLLQSRLSDSIEQCNEPPRYRLHRNFA